MVKSEQSAKSAKSVRVSAKISYNGARFDGFAPQHGTGRKTVFSALICALNKLQITSELLYAGRTDKGVHASGQVVSFVVPFYWHNRLNEVMQKINQIVKPYIFIKNMRVVCDDFHPRFSAKSRTYIYIIKQGRVTPFESDFFLGTDSIDIYQLKQSWALFNGRHDFAYFKKSGGTNHTTIREVFKTAVKIKGANIYLIITANAYLRSQIRLAVSACLLCASGKISLQDIQNQLALKTKTTMQPVIPNGLYLSSVTY